MKPEEKFSLRLLAVAIPTVCSVIGAFIAGCVGASQPAEPTLRAGLLLGFLVGLFAVALYIPLIELHIAKAESRNAVTESSVPTSVPAVLPAPAPESTKPGAKKPDTSDLDRERAERLKELKAAAEDPDSPLDEITVGAQEREIEADYQRKLAERVR